MNRSVKLCFLALIVLLLGSGLVWSGGQGDVGAAEKVDQKRLMNLLFSASFSSRESAGNISGRGFGLDVVRDAVSHLGGHISVSTRKLQGTRFTLRIPDDGATEEAE